MIELTLPRLTERMVSGRLVAWLKREGDRIETGAPTCLIETDGAVITVESPVEGVLAKAVAEAGSVLPIGALLGYVGPPGENGAAVPPGGASPGLWNPQSDLLERSQAGTSAEGRDPSSGVVFPGTVVIDVDMTDAVGLRERLMGRWESRAGVPLSLNHMVIKATALALKGQPQTGAAPSHPAARDPRGVDLGVCIFDGGGVVTPVIRDAARLPLVEISIQMASFGERAAEHRLASEEDPNVAVTIANLGKYGADAAFLAGSARTAVLGVGRCIRKPVLVDDELKFLWVMTLSLSFDGRTMDAARASQLLGLVKGVLEKPSALVH